jgi:predicted  nucleic acid-binding Zn-ribbon protein
MTKQAQNKVLLTCPHCGHDRFQIHDRGRLYAIDGKKPELEQDEIAVQCLQCLAVSVDRELIATEVE